MDKEKIIEILEDYEFFVDDDFGGHYEHINCSQKALTPLGIVEILDYISELEQQVKTQKEVIDKTKIFLKNEGQKQYNIHDNYRGKWYSPDELDILNKILEDKLEDKEVSDE